MVVFLVGWLVGGMIGKSGDVGISTLARVLLCLCISSVRAAALRSTQVSREWIIAVSRENRLRTEQFPY